MRFFSKIADIWRHEELRNKIGITLGLILVYRIGSFIVLPGVNPDALADQSEGLGGLLSLFTGGAFSRASTRSWYHAIHFGIDYHSAYEYCCSSCTEDATRG